MQEVSAWLGHSSVATTEKVYAHITIAMRQRAAKVLDKLMGFESKETEKPKNIEDAITQLFELWTVRGTNIYHANFVQKKPFEPAFEPEENMQNIQPIGMNA